MRSLLNRLSMGWIAVMVLLLTAPSMFAGEAAYGLARFEVPDGWPVGRLYGSYVCRMPNLPENKRYLFFVDFTGLTGQDIRRYFRDAFKDHIVANPGEEGLKPQITSEPDGQLAAQELTAVDRNGETVHVFLCVIDRGKARQCAGIITNDEQLWQTNHAHFEAFRRSLRLEIELVGPNDPRAKSTTQPATARVPSDISH